MDLRAFCRVGSSGEQLLRTVITRFKLNPCVYDRILKAARTVADLAGTDELCDEFLFEAITYRRSTMLKSIDE